MLVCVVCVLFAVYLFFTWFTTYKVVHSCVCSFIVSCNIFFDGIVCLLDECETERLQKVTSAAAKQRKKNNYPNCIWIGTWSCIFFLLSFIVFVCAELFFFHLSVLFIYLNITYIYKNFVLKKGVFNYSVWV